MWPAHLSNVDCSDIKHQCFACVQAQRNYFLTRRVGEEIKIRLSARGRRAPSVLYIVECEGVSVR